MSARERLYKYFKENGIGEYDGDDLRTIGEISDWARVIRQLSQDEIIDYEYNKASNQYAITFIGEYQKSTKRTDLSSKDKYRIRNRDGHKCQSCGRGPDDGIKLHVDHKTPLDWGGSNSDDNLWTLCSECNLAKKNFFQDDFDSKVMKLVSQEKSGYQKLKILFENSPNKKFIPSILQGISGIRDWTRSVRDIRLKHNINIVWTEPSKEFPNGYYSNIV